MAYIRCNYLNVDDLDSVTLVYRENPSIFTNFLSSCTLWKLIFHYLLLFLSLVFNVMIIVFHFGSAIFGVNAIIIKTTADNKWLYGNWSLDFMNNEIV